MRGTIKSFSAEKGYGFVDGQDGQSYFLHQKNLCDAAERKSLVIGAIVDFDPTPTPKGMQANLVKVLPTLVGKSLAPFTFTRNGPKPDVEVLWQHEINPDRYYRQMDEAEQAAEEFARRMGANAVLNLRLVKSTTNNGNYYYSVFTPKFTLAVIAKKVVVESQQMVSLMEAQAKAAINLVQSNLEESEKAAQLAAAQGRKSSMLKKIVVTSLIFIFYFWVFNLGK